MSIVDIVIILMLVFFTYFGARRGLVNELLGLTGWILSFLVALAACDYPAAILNSKFPKLGMFSTLFSIVAILIIIRIFIQVSANALQNVMKKKNNSFGDYFGGSLLGFIQGLFLMSVLVLTITIFPFNEAIKSIENQSVLYNHVEKFSVYIVQTVAKYVPKTKTAVDSVVNKLESKPGGKSTPAKGQENKTPDETLSQEELEKIIQNELREAGSKKDLRR